jgi:hypothetical protein
MIFTIDFDNPNFNDDEFLISLGAYWVDTGSNKYPPFQVLEIEIRDFEHLEEILRLVDMQYNVVSDAVISFDSPTLYIQL